MNEQNKKPEISEEDLSRVVKMITVEVLREHQEEIIRRAHQRLREIAKSQTAAE